MPKLAWTQDLAVGIAEIDDQHRQWIGRFNDVAAAIAAKQGASEISRTLDFLSDYTKQHFATEEKQMTAAAYPGLHAHLAQHRELTATLEDLLRDFHEEGATPKLAETVNTYLGNWLVTHIRERDLEFGRFAKTRVG